MEKKRLPPIEVSWPVTIRLTGEHLKAVESIVFDLRRVGGFSKATRKSVIAHFVEAGLKSMAKTK